MKTFVYMVENRVWEDTNAWGNTWRAVKAYAIQHHSIIYRDVIETGKPIWHQVYFTTGIFNSVEFMKNERECRL